MSSDLATVDLEAKVSGTDVSTSDVSNETLGKQAIIPWKIGRVIQVAGILLSIAVPPATAVLDYWFFEGRRRYTSTVTSTLEGEVGTPISRAEALQIASQILVQAENERIELAELESERGVQWED